MHQTISNYFSLRINFNIRSQCFFKTFLDVPRAPPHLLDFWILCVLLGAMGPKLPHHCLVDLRFIPVCTTLDASATSVYDDNEMLCSILRQLNSEIEKVTIR